LVTVSNAFKLLQLRKRIPSLAYIVLPFVYLKHLLYVFAMILTHWYWTSSTCWLIFSYNILNTAFR